jgi:hypothetical protein
MRAVVAVVVAACAVCGCGSQSSAKKNVGDQTADIVVDNRVVAEANAASAEVVRAAGDCDAVKAALPTARQRLDEIATRVRTETGRASLEGIRKRVREIGEACP